MIILLAGLVIGTNLSLIAALRNRSKKQSSPQFLDSWKVMKNPWNEEERKWGELAEKVKDLDNHSAEEDRDQPPRPLG